MGCGGFCLEEAYDAVLRNEFACCVTIADEWRLTVVSPSVGVRSTEKHLLRSVVKASAGGILSKVGQILSNNVSTSLCLAKCRFKCL